MRKSFGLESEKIEEKKWKKIRREREREVTGESQM